MTPRHRALVVALALCWFGAGPLWAYLDPASGSILLQALAAGLLAILVTIRAYWRRLVGWFRRDRSSQTPEEKAREPQPDEP